MAGAPFAEAGLRRCNPAIPQTQKGETCAFASLFPFLSTPNEMEGAVSKSEFFDLAADDLAFIVGSKLGVDPDSVFVIPFNGSWRAQIVGPPGDVLRLQREADRTVAAMQVQYRLKK